MIPGPAHSITRTRDAAEARAILCDRYKPHDMRRIADPGGFDFVHMSAAVPDGSLNILKYGSAVEITPQPFQDFFMLEMPVRAGVGIETDGGGHAQSGPSTALFLAPDMRFRSTWAAGCVQIMLKLRADAILRRWRRVTGDDTAGLPVFRPEIDLETPEGWRVQQMLLMMRREFERAVIRNADTLAQSPLSGATLDAVLDYYRVHGVDPAPSATPPLPAALKRCIDHIGVSLHGDLSVPALLAVSGTSERTLFNLFRRFLDTTPQAHVRAERLKAARALLTSGRRSVAEAAAAVGIAHLGRFSAAYRDMFGEPPSATGRR